MCEVHISKRVFLLIKQFTIIEFNLRSNSMFENEHLLSSVTYLQLFEMDL